ncbi:hypothetical protein ACO2I3_03825 [Leptospira interrogans]
MFKAPYGRPGRSGIDLATVRDLLTYIQRDLRLEHANIRPLGLTGDPALLTRLFPQRR